MSAPVFRACRQIAGRVPAGVAALMLGVSSVAMLAGDARADCDPLADGTGQTITCDADDNNAGDQTSYNALGGNDTIDIISGTYTGTIDGGDGDDTITLNGASAVVNTIRGGNDDDTIDLLSGTVTTNVRGDLGDDTVTLNGASVGLYILGDTGADTINLLSGSASAVFGDADDDTITLNGAGVTGLTLINAGSGNDTIDLVSGTLGGNLAGIDGDDTITLNGASVTGTIFGDDNAAAVGNDTIDILSGTVGGVDGDAGADTINLNGGTVTGNVGGDAGNDTITLNGTSVGGNITGGADDDTVALISGSLGSAFGQDGNDTLTLNGASITGSVDGGSDDDTINLLSGSAASVNGSSGKDTITLNGASFTGVIQGGSDDDTIDLISGTSGSVFASSGKDTITLNGISVTVGNIDGGSDEDVIELLSGTAAAVFGGLQNDTITLNGATLNNNIDGDDGDDTIIVQSGMTTTILGDLGDDTITLNGGSASGSVKGNAGNDTITLNGASITLDIEGDENEDTIAVLSGTVRNVEGGADNDMITLNGGTVTGEVDGDAGEDTITLNGTSVTGNLRGGGDDDTINILSGSIGNHLLGEQGHDIITLNGGTVAGVVSGGLQNDTITLNGTAVTGDIFADENEDTIVVLSGSVNNVRGGADNDMITLNGGTVGTDVFGDAGDDSITLNGTTVVGNLDGGDDDDTFILISGASAGFGGDLLGGDGSDAAVIWSGYDLSTINGKLDGGDDAATGDGWIDILTVEASGTLSGVDVINWETVNINGGITLLMDGGSIGTSSEDGYGLFVNENSTLDLGGGLNVTGDVRVNAGSTLRADTPGGNGSYYISDDLRNYGTVDMSDGAGAGDWLRIGGDYMAGSALHLDAALDATEAADGLDIDGDISGVTELTITDTNPGGPPSFTGDGAGNGLVLVDNSDGGDIEEGDFIFDPVAHPTDEMLKVPFAYTLSVEDDDILYLQSDVLAQVYGYAILAEMMREDFPTLRDRLGDRTYNGFGEAPANGEGGSGVWARVEGQRRDIAHSGDYTTSQWQATRGEIEVGLDLPMEVGGGTGVAGISAHFVKGYGDAHSGLTSDPETAGVNTTGIGAGLSFAWFPGGGFYADAQGRVTSWDADVEVGGARDIDQNVDGFGWGASLEVGNRVTVGDNTAVTPRGQAVYTDVDFDSFTDADGVKVSQDDSASLVLSGGLVVETLFPTNGVALFADASVNHDMLSDSSINASGFKFESGLEDTWGTLEVGGSMEVGNGTSAYVSGEISSPFGSTFGDSLGYGMKAGVRIRF